MGDFETMLGSYSNLGSIEEPREVDVPAEDVRGVIHHLKHRHRSAKLSDSKQCANNTDVTDSSPVSETSVQDDASVCI